MAPKKRYGEGNTWARKNAAGVIIGYESKFPNGSGGYIYRRTKTEKEGNAWRAEMKRQRAQHINVGAARQTVRQVRELWLETIVRPRRSSRTAKAYRAHSEALMSYIGDRPIADLTSQQMDRALTLMGAETKPDGSPRYSPSSVDRARDVLRNMLNQAMKWDLVARNAAALSTPIEASDFQAHPLRRHEATRFLETVRGTRYEALWLLAVLLGPREGEMLGLTWEHVDFEHGVIRIRRQLQDGALVKLKTRQSSRDLRMVPQVAVVLHAHRARQRELQLLAGSAWKGRRDGDFVFTTRVGTPLLPSNLRRTFLDLLRTAGLPQIRIHDLRHTAISLMAEQGVHPSVVQQIAGHADIRTTLKYYTHVTAEQTGAAAASLAAVLLPGADESEVAV
jgi:integrase